jgi:aspartyl-tRNA synthetase
MRLAEFARKYGAKGLPYVPSSPANSAVLRQAGETGSAEAITKALEAKPGDLLLFVADKPRCLKCWAGYRMLLAEHMGIIDKDILAFCWVIDFPFVMWNEEEKRWDPSHHLFTSPMVEDILLLDSAPGKARGQQYDLVLNNYAVGGGSIRIHERPLQEKVFKLIGLDPEVAKERFGHMLEAFEYGTPPHGGIAPGIDRICMILGRAEHCKDSISKANGAPDGRCAIARRARSTQRVTSQN